MAKNKKGTYKSPNIQYYQSRGDFNIAVGEDFIHAINDLSSNEQHFLVGLSHGQSPSGAYNYILENYHSIRAVHWFKSINLFFTSFGYKHFFLVMLPVS